MEQILTNLRKRGYKVYYAKNSEEAIKITFEIIKEGSSIGFGGSMTIEELDIHRKLMDKGYQVYHRSLSPDVAPKVLYNKMHLADWYISSANALTKDGDIINIDGRGNRVAELIYGPPNSLIICGENKIVDNIQDGIDRVRNIAAPLNAKRLNKRTPCVVTGKCSYCNSPDCICRATTIQHHPSLGAETSIIIIKGSYGY